MIRRLFIVPLLFAVPLLLLAYEKENTGYHFPFTDTDAGNEWRVYVDEETITDWSARHGLDLVEDQYPWVDGIAFYPSQRGSCTVVTVSDPMKRYTLHVDFVRYRQYEAIPAMLSITMKPAGEERSTVLHHHFRDIPLDGYVSLSLPFEYTISGSITVCFREFPFRAGYWGIWDMVVTERGEQLPERIKTPQLPSREQAVEKDN